LTIQLINNIKILEINSVYFSNFVNKQKTPPLKGFVINKLGVAPGGIEPPTQGFSGLCITLEKFKISTIFPPEGCRNNYNYQLPQKHISKQTA
jgi:hypothetical protein